MAKRSKAAAAAATVTDIFAAASTIDPFPIKKSSKNKERDTVSYGNDLDLLAAIEIMIKSLKGVSDQMKEEVRERSFDEFVARGKETKAHPANFIAAGEVSEASIEMRRRGSNIPLSEEIKEELVRLKLPVQENVKIEDRYVFNSELLANPEIRQAVSEAFSSHPALKNIAGNLIQKQVGVSTCSVSEETLQMAAAKLSAADYRRLLPEMTTLAVGKFTMEGESVESGGRGENKAVTPKAKLKALEILQKNGLLPK